MRDSPGKGKTPRKNASRTQEHIRGSSISRTNLLATNLQVTTQSNTLQLAIMIRHAYADITTRDNQSPVPMVLALKRALGGEHWKKSFHWILAFLVKSKTDKQSNNCPRVRTM